MLVADSLASCKISNTNQSLKQIRDFGGSCGYLGSLFIGL